MISRPFQGTLFTTITLNPESNCSCGEKHHSQFLGNTRKGSGLQIRHWMYCCRSLSTIIGTLMEIENCQIDGQVSSGSLFLWKKKHWMWDMWHHNWSMTHLTTWHSHSSFLMSQCSVWPCLQGVARKSPHMVAEPGGPWKRIVELSIKAGEGLLVELKVKGSITELISRLLGGDFVWDQTESVLWRGDVEGWHGEALIHTWNSCVQIHSGQWGLKPIPNLAVYSGTDSRCSRARNDETVGGNVGDHFREQNPTADCEAYRWYSSSAGYGGTGGILQGFPSGQGKNRVLQTRPSKPLLFHSLRRSLRSLSPKCEKRRNRLWTRMFSTDKKVNDLQTRLFVADIWKDMSEATKRREKHKWAIEKAEVSQCQKIA